jgi:drug/metabolite transporter (DMT)-like permease
MKTAIVIALIVLADSIGDVLLTKGMRQVGEVTTLAPRELWRTVCRAAHSRYLLASIGFMVVHFIGFLVALSWADLSVVFPATCLVYVFSTLGGKFILGETISGHRWTGTTLVCVGVGLISWP